MAEIRTVTTLTSKRDEIARSIVNYERKLAQARADLSHVNATLAIFAGGSEPGGHRVYVDLARVFRYGEIAALCVKELTAGELTTPELSARLLKVKGLDPEDRVLIKSICLSVVQSMRGLERRNKVRLVCKRAGICVWALPSGDVALPIALPLPRDRMLRGPLHDTNKL